jgi:hypothetical protein
MPFVLKNFDTIEIPSTPTYLVQGLLPDVGLAVVFGPEKCGKSFWLFHVMMHVALGWEYRGHDVIQGPVVYCALEGGRGFARRIVAFRQEFLAQDADPVPFWLLDVRIELAHDHPALIAAIRSQLNNSRPAAVVIDTLNRAINGSENDDKDMGKFIRAADAVREAFNCLVVIIHHTPLSGNRPRGHSSLAGADDCQISVEKNDASGIITCKVRHMKDDFSDVVLASKLKQVEIGEDSKHNPITSCVVETVKATPGAKKHKLADTSQFGLDLLVKLISDKATGLPAPTALGLPSGVRVTRADTWRERFIDDYQAIKDRENRSRTFRRVYGDLNKHKLIGGQGDFIWLTSDVPGQAGQAGQT